MPAHLIHGDKRTIVTKGLAGMAQHVPGVLDRIPYSLLALAARIFPAAVFWQSGETKVDGWHLSDNAVDLFRDEYRLPVIDPTLAAYLAAFAEHCFPVSARACEPFRGACASLHDARHRGLRLSGCLAHPWRLGDLFPCRHRAGLAYSLSITSSGAATNAGDNPD